MRKNAQVWRNNAACRDREDGYALFFPPRFKDAEPAKQICYDCPVRRECLEYALKFFIKEGVWGGFYATEIRKKGRAYLDQPYEYYAGRKPSFLRVAVDRGEVSVRHYDSLSGR